MATADEDNLSARPRKPLVPRLRVQLRRLLILDKGARRRQDLRLRRPRALDPAGGVPLEHRTWPSDGIRFEVLDLYDLPKRHLEPFDITLFKGIFYHLPDPVAGLKVAADMTREVLLVDTEVRLDLPDGMLVVRREGTEHPMSGVYGLNWFPTGPDVMARILNWMGFPETRVTSWIANRTREREQFGRLQIVGAREPGRLDQLEPVTEPTR